MGVGKLLYGWCDSVSSSLPGHLHVILTPFTDATCAALYVLYFGVSASVTLSSDSGDIFKENLIVRVRIRRLIVL